MPLVQLIRNKAFTSSQLNKRATGTLIEYMGITILNIKDGFLESTMLINSNHMAPNEFIHAASIVALADSSCGCATIAHLPQNMSNFATIELKSNHLATAKNGALICQAKIEHSGKRTQVWDAIVNHKETKRKIALFRCTQMLF